MELDDVKAYLRVDSTAEDDVIELMMEAASKFIEEAVGQFDTDDARAKLLFLAVVQDLYDNRTLVASSTQGYSVSESMRKMRSDFIFQLQVEQLGEE